MCDPYIENLSARCYCLHDSVRSARLQVRLGNDDRDAAESVDQWKQSRLTYIEADKLTLRELVARTVEFDDELSRVRSDATNWNHDTTADVRERFVGELDKVMSMAASLLYEALMLCHDYATLRLGIASSLSPDLRESLVQKTHNSLSKTDLSSEIVAAANAAVSDAMNDMDLTLCDG